MKHCGVQQNALAAACDEVRSPFVSSSVVADRRVPVFCPKPRRLYHLSAADPVVRPFRRQQQLGLHVEPCDSRAGAEILDIILSKGGVEEQSPPSFFCGSPPSRSVNPLIFDACFGKENPSTPLTPLPFPTIPAAMSPSSSSSPSSASSRKGGCVVRTKFGLKPAAVRIEGFDCCLDRDNRRNRGITAVA